VYATERNKRLSMGSRCNNPMSPLEAKKAQENCAANRLLKEWAAQVQMSGGRVERSSLAELGSAQAKDDRGKFASGRCHCAKKYQKRNMEFLT